MLEFNLKRDLVFFDIESTGLNVLRDRIIQIGLIKHFANGADPVEKDVFINPGIPISNESMQVHGITADMLRNKPTFRQVAKELFQFIGDADMAGYNSDRFDLPMLMEEFARTGYNFDISIRRCIDVQKIFYKMEPRTLRAALKFYAGKKLTNAHDALADVRATIDVLKGQISHYKGVDYESPDGDITKEPIRNDMDVLHAFIHDPKRLDLTQRLKYNEQGEIVFNFGKYNGQIVSKVLASDKNYFNWILNKDFSTQMKQIIRKIAKENETPGS